MRPWRAALALTWAALIFALSHQPRLPEPPVTFAGVDKVLHALVYGILAGLVYRSLTGSRRALVALCVTVAYGISDELHQALVPGRSPDALDVLADTLGAMAVIAFALLRARRKHYQSTS